ncbi:MAG: hypothetical protein J0L56_18010 [Chitinophagales bacterium]|nr:hypothetical protein [Chitinophagales bacterium]
MAENHSASKGMTTFNLYPLPGAVATVTVPLHNVTQLKAKYANQPSKNQDNCNYV